MNVSTIKSVQNGLDRSLRFTVFEYLQKISHLNFEKKSSKLHLHPGASEDKPLGTTPVCFKMNFISKLGRKIV